MRKYLLPQSKNAYKANLHCHSTVSDGKMSPEVLKEKYKGEGYSILAYTDHEVLALHSELSDGEFLALAGYEIQIYGDMELPKLLRRVCHINAYPEDPTNNRMPFFNLDDVMRLDVTPNLSLATYDGDGNEYKEYSAKGINSLIKKLRNAGFIVSYNHPTWSREDASTYTNLDGLFAMEIYNHNSQMSGTDAYCPYVYDEMLRSGQRIGCIATDDTHKPEDAFGGFTVVYADELSHASVIEALKRGDFYSSRGPIIKALWYEGGEFHLECTPVSEVKISSSGRRKPETSVKRDKDGGIIRADFPLSPMDVFVRFTLTDSMGRTANTRGYWREEFEESEACVGNVCERRVGKE